MKYSPTSISPTVLIVVNAKVSKSVWRIEASSVDGAKRSGLDWWRHELAWRQRMGYTGPQLSAMTWHQIRQLRCTTTSSTVVKLHNQSGGWSSERDRRKIPEQFGELVWLGTLPFVAKLRILA